MHLIPAFETPAGSAIRSVVRSIALTAALLLSPAVAPAAAQSSVSVLVNDEPITSYDIKARTKMLAVFTRGKQGEKAAIEQLIDERLMLQEAKRRSIMASDADVEEEVAKRASSSKLTSAQFRQAMRQAGIDPKTFEGFLRANMTWGRIVRARLQATVEVSDQDITAVLTNRKDTGEQKTISEFMLQPILFIMQPGAGAGVESQKRSQANAFRSSFKGCDQTIQQAGGMPGVVVKPTVRREETQLTGAMKEEVLAASVGGITNPQRVEEGIQLIAICEKREVAGRTEATEEVRDELSNERGQLLARRYLRDLRSDAVIEYR